MGMDLFNALWLQISDGKVTVSKTSPVTNPSVPLHYTTVKMEPTVNAEITGTVKGFIHKVKVRPDLQPVQMKLRHQPFAVRDQVSEELQRLEKDGVIEHIDSSPWVLPVVVLKRKYGRLRICPDLREPNKAVIATPCHTLRRCSISCEEPKCFHPSTCRMRITRYRFTLRAETFPVLLDTMDFFVSQRSRSVLPQVRVHFRA